MELTAQSEFVFYAFFDSIVTVEPFLRTQIHGIRSAVIVCAVFLIRRCLDRALWLL